MNPYVITPWDTLESSVTGGAVLEQYVPPELEAMAWQVAELYDMQVYNMTLITSKPDKGGAIWRIDTNHGPRSLKVLHRSPQRSLFSIGAQEHMVSQGAKVPALVPTRADSTYVEAGGKLWIVTDWIEPLQPVSKVDLEGAAALCYGLGEFHKLSKGYVPPQGAQNSSRLTTWPKYYDKIITKIGWFRDIASIYREFPASEHLLNVVEEFERQARETNKLLLASEYAKMVSKGGPHWGLVHQDYGWSNGQMGPGGIWVIDLDGVSYDLPIRDLRKLITSTMDDMGTWDPVWIRGMIEAYHQANPIDRETFELLWIDMAFPNEFYKHVKEIVFSPQIFLQTELEAILTRVMTVESSKWQALQELEGDKTKYESGNYVFESAPAFQYEFEPVPARDLPGSMVPMLPVAEEAPVPVTPAYQEAVLIAFPGPADQAMPEDLWTPLAAASGDTIPAAPLLVGPAPAKSPPASRQRRKGKHRRKRLPIVPKAVKARKKKKIVRKKPAKLVPKKRIAAAVKPLKKKPTKRKTLTRKRKVAAKKRQPARQQKALTAGSSKRGRRPKIA